MTTYATLRPVGHKALVRLDRKATTHSGTGLLIPDLWRKQPELATVISVGPGDERGPCQISPGQRVYVGKWNGIEVPPPEGAESGYEYRVVNVDPDKRFGDALNTSRVIMQDVYGTVEDE